MKLTERLKLGITACLPWRDVSVRVLALFQRQSQHDGLVPPICSFKHHAHSPSQTLTERASQTVLLLPRYVTVHRLFAALILRNEGYLVPN